MTQASLIAKQAAGDLLASAKPFDDGAKKVNDIIPLLEKIEQEHNDAIYHLRNLVAYVEKTESENVNFTLQYAQNFLQEIGQR